MSCNKDISKKMNDESSIPPFVIAPVADIFAKKGEKQGTQTQMIGYPGTDTDNDDIVPNSKK